MLTKIDLATANHCAQYQPILLAAKRSPVVLPVVAYLVLKLSSSRGDP
ncbi:MAG: hypothetical protein SFY66_05190 [Oculatellaceae cyanobacterium bins.114]|nr:hypothetical protein [Oculatellaceae cyanobacterium bins.114]